MDVHLHPSSESFALDYDDASVAALIERLVALEPALVVLEAPGGGAPPCLERGGAPLRPLVRSLHTPTTE